MPVTFKDQATEMIILAPSGSLKNWASDTVTDTSVAMPVPQLVYDGATEVDVIDGVNRGVAVLKRSRGNAGNAVDALTVVSDDGIPANNKAHKLRVDAESDGLYRTNPAETIAFYAPGDPEPITRAIIGSDVDMVWDEPLQRLFIGLSDVTRGHNVGAVTNKSGGVCSVLVGKVDANQKITLYPVLKNPSSYLFADVRNPDAASFVEKDAGNYNKYILGFYENNTNNNNTTTPVDLFASARAVRTMHTSTGKSYLIVNGGVGSRTNNPRNVNTQIYAMPLVDEGNDAGFVGF
ncbi:MAG: hypothetical protein IPP67_03725 [Rhodospirillaceae bacterium]|nr:hypothetical protein [Rhodospirillaceae bacterium]